MVDFPEPVIPVTSTSPLLDCKIVLNDDGILDYQDVQVLKAKF